MRENVSIVQDASGQTSGPGRPVMGHLGHMRSSVSCLVTFGPRILYKVSKKRSTQEIVKIEWTTRYCNTSNGLFAWEKQRCLGTIMICDGENGIVSFQWQQINDEIQGNYAEGYKGMLGRNREQRDPWFCRPCLGCLTGGASLDVIFHEFPKSRPPIPM